MPLSSTSIFSSPSAHTFTPAILETFSGTVQRNAGTWGGHSDEQIIVNSDIRGSSFPSNSFNLQSGLTLTNLVLLLLSMLEWVLLFQFRKDVGNFHSDSVLTRFAVCLQASRAQSLGVAPAVEEPSWILQPSVQGWAEPDSGCTETQHLPLLLQVSHCFLCCFQDYAFSHAHTHMNTYKWVILGLVIEVLILQHQLHCLWMGCHCSNTHQFCVCSLLML